MKYKVLCVFFAAFIAANSYSQAYESTKKIERVFGLDKTTEVRVYNKYGNINIIPWKQDSVKFIIDLKVSGKKEFKVERVMDNIRFNFIEGSENISVYTSFENDKGAFWKDVSDFANIIFKGGTKANIDYAIYIPENQNLHIENKFGNFYTSDYSGNLVLKISNGDIKANKLNGINNIESSFGSIILDHINEGTIDLSYADINVKNINTVSLESKSSKIHIDKAESIEIQSRRDKFYFRNLNKLKGEASFTYIDIGKLTEKIDLRTNYGDINIDMVNQSFDFINLVSDYTDCNIRLPATSSFNFEINYDNRVNLYLPEDISKLEPRDLGSNRYTLSGMTGKDPVADIKVSKSGGILSIEYFNDFH